MTVTVEALRAVRLRPGMHADGQGFSQWHYRCIEFPEPTKVVTHRRRPERARHTTFYVAGVEVAADYQAIAEALNALPVRCGAAA